MHSLVRFSAGPVQGGFADRANSVWNEIPDVSIAKIGNRPRNRGSIGKPYIERETVIFPQIGKWPRQRLGFGPKNRKILCGKIQTLNSNGIRSMHTCIHSARTLHTTTTAALLLLRAAGGISGRSGSRAGSGETETKPPLPPITCCCCGGVVWGGGVSQYSGMYGRDRGRRGHSPHARLRFWGGEREGCLLYTSPSPRD